MIFKKMKRLESSYRIALDWTNCTGQGVKETNPGGYESYVKRLCPHFYTLAPIIQDRANARCIVNLDALRGVVGSDGQSSCDGSQVQYAHKQTC
jgi:hypothetical protein